MAYVTPDKFSPYPRCCDICGQLRSIATMRKLDGITWVCSKHTGERTRIMLDLLNAHARPPTTWPNLNAKPQNPEYPNTLEADEGAAFAFIDRQIQAQCRYEAVGSGRGPLAGGAVPAMAWAARYLYGLIVQGTRTTLLARARVLLAQAADYLLTRQYGSATGPSPTSTRATDSFYGAVLESGATVFETDDVAASGLALLYAYRILSTATYIQGSRSAASYLRNVQAIGSNGTHYTSTDSAGVTRLYTGSLASQVSTTAGMYSNSLFYPSALIALEFWNELTTTDGDQSLGLTAAISGFSTAPAQLMSTSMTDLRDCWTDGITDSTATVVNGLSATTPREFFNAYPATKTNFSLITGTGLWEYADGPAATGTQITSQNFARALASLYAYEGATSQVTAILTWLRSFTSNEDFETADDTPDSVLQRATTGDYDPTIALATLLTVRDSAASYAATATNGSSLYDWGAFGILASLSAATNMTSFKTARLGALNVRPRFDDGRPSDGLNYDRIELRGRSGLTSQTAYATNILSGALDVPFELYRNTRGSNLIFDDSMITVPTGELARSNYWRFTLVDDNDGNSFPFAQSTFTLPVGSQIVLYNGTGGLLHFNHMAVSATATGLPFWLTTQAIFDLPDTYVIVFTRDSSLTAWKQTGPIAPTVSTDGLQSPIVVVNDAVRSAQYSTSFRGAH